MRILTEAYKKIFGVDPVDLQTWEIARAVINDFDVPKIGEELARKVILEIVNHVKFPTNKLTKKVVGHAENLATELFDKFNKPGKEPHMAEFEYLEWKKKNQ